VRACVRACMRACVNVCVNSHALVINVTDRHLLDVSSHTNFLKLVLLRLKYAIILLCLAVYISLCHHFGYVKLDLQ